MTTQALRHRVRRFSYRHPASWSAAKRAAVVGVTVGGLALGARKARGVAVMALGRSQTLREKKRLVRGLMSSYGVLPGQGAREIRTLKSIDRALPRMRLLRRAADVRASRLGTAAKLTGAGGLGYAGIPIARDVGHRRYYKAQTRNAKPLTVIYRSKKRRQ